MAEYREFVIRLRTPATPAAYARLRMALKTLLRKFGFTCLEAKEIVPDVPKENVSAQA